MDGLKDLQSIPIYVWVIVGIALLIQASWIFWDAAKRGEHKWLWGFFGLINAPGNLIIYLIVTRVILKSKPCQSCSRNVRGNYAYCPHCGEKINNINR